MKRAGLYIRVSGPEQEKHGTSLATQLADCRAYADQHGYSVVQEESDVFTGTTMSRRGLEAILDAGRDGMLDIVVCYAIDRASRDLADFVLIDRELSKHNVALEFVRDRRDPGPQGDLFTNIRAAFGQYERAVLVERMRRGRLERVRQGNVLNSAHVPYGYRYNAGNRNLDIEEPEASIVREIFQHVGHKGGSMQSIADSFIERNIPTPAGKSRWYSSTVAAIIHNEVYKGSWTFNKARIIKQPRKRAYPDPVTGKKQGDMVFTKHRHPASEWIRVPVPAIVSEELWEAAQRQVSRNSTLATRNRRSDYLVANLIWCAHCAGRMWGHSTTKGGKEHEGTYYYYRCHRYAGARFRPEDVGVLYQVCPVQRIRKEAVEEAVWEEVARQFSNDSIVRRALSAPTPGDPAHSASNVARIEALEAQKASAEREAERLLDIYLAGALSREKYIERMGKINRRLTTLASERSKIEAEIFDMQARREAVKDMQQRIELVRAGIPFMDFADRRALLVAWDVRITVHRAPDKGADHLIDIDGLLQPVRNLVVQPVRRSNASSNPRRKKAS